MGAVHKNYPLCVDVALSKQSIYVSLFYVQMESLQLEGRSMEAPAAMLRNMISPELRTEFNWAGQRGTKRCFRGTATCKVIIGK